MDEAYRNLWIAVLKQAIKDVEKYHGGFSTENSLSWFDDENEEIGSFQWICKILDLNPGSIKSLVKY
jgi:hypothetical protein